MLSNRSEPVHERHCRERRWSRPLITVCRSDERRHVRHGAQDTWLTLFPPSLSDRLAGDHGPGQLLTEDRLAPGARFTPPLDHDAEVVTYVLEGALEYDDPAGRARMIYAGEFQRSNTRSGVRHGGRNGSRKHSVHLFQIRLHAAVARSGPSAEQKRFCAAERRGLLCVVAAPDGRNGSLCIQHDALIHSAIISPGQHVVHELAQRRSAWVQVVRGEAALGDVVLFAGDGAAVSAERAVSLTAREETELLLLDLCD
jgi:quercetin 2,3-dioxygenase